MAVGGPIGIICTVLFFYGRVRPMAANAETITVSFIQYALIQIVTIAFFIIVQK